MGLAAASSRAILRTLASCRNLNEREREDYEEGECRGERTVRVDLVVEREYFQPLHELNQLYD